MKHIKIIYSAIGGFLTVAIIVWVVGNDSTANRSSDTTIGAPAKPVYHATTTSDPLRPEPGRSHVDLPLPGAVASGRDLMPLLGLGADRLAQVDAFLASKREGVLEEFAKYAKATPLDAGGIAISVHLPNAVAEGLRREFYEGLADILGDEVEDYLLARNATRLEAQFEFFGEFPIVYEIVADSGKLSDAAEIRFRANVIRSSGTSFVLGNYDATGLKERYGAIATLALDSAR
jgi:hypothetical protein